MLIVDNSYDFGRNAEINAISDVSAMGGTPVMALGIVGMPVNVLLFVTVGAILPGGLGACRAAGTPIASDHTIGPVESIDGLVVMDLIHPTWVSKNPGVQVGDVLVLGKPLAAGVLSSALENRALGAEGYACMVATATQPNKPGIELSDRA